jgi:hypothetical protein
MVIIDQRQVTFDSIALKQIVDLSPYTARNIGFPNNEPTNIALNPAAHSATFEFAGTAVTLQRVKLGALLISSYCIRSGIEVPRNGQRSVRIEPTTVTLVFRQEFLKVAAIRPIAKHDQKPADLPSDLLLRLIARRCGEGSQSSASLLATAARPLAQTSPTIAR